MDYLSSLNLEILEDKNFVILLRIKKYIIIQKKELN